MKAPRMKLHIFLIALAMATSAWSEPMTVDAERLDVDQTANTATFSGSVSLKRADFTLTANTLVGDIQTTSDNRTFTAKGNVIITRRNNDKTETATGDTATYVPATGILIITGNTVTLTSGKTVLTGTRLEYDTRTGKASLKGGGGVRGSFGQ